jgi:hypothetical protein
VRSGRVSDDSALSVSEFSFSLELVEIVVPLQKRVVVDRSFSGFRARKRVENRISGQWHPQLEIYLGM